jgi:DNA/RNA endonuclease YhcR with UshA esterase domain
MWAIQFLVLALALASSPAFAATISPGDAARHINERATVEGTVAKVFTDPKSNTTFLDFGAPYPDETFTAVVFSDYRSAFGDLSADEGKTVDVTGAIKDYRGSPEIVLSDPSQLEVR